MTTNERYIELETKLLTGRDAGTISEQEDDTLSEELAELWYDLTPEEQEAARIRTAPWVKKYLEQANKPAKDC